MALVLYRQPWASDLDPYRRGFSPPPAVCHRNAYVWPVYLRNYLAVVMMTSATLAFLPGSNLPLTIGITD